jgi:hypothetical protein
LNERGPIVDSVVATTIGFKDALSTEQQQARLKAKQMLEQCNADASHKKRAKVTSAALQQRFKALKGTNRPARIHPGPIALTDTRFVVPSSMCTPQQCCARQALCVIRQYWQTVS